MPKRRSNTISTVANNVGGSAWENGAIGPTGSGMSLGIINNLAERINERLREYVIVQGYSRTRAKMEDISIRYNEVEDNFTVHSDEGDLGQVRSNAEHYAMEFSEIASSTQNMRFNLESDENVREMASGVSRMNRYYGINLKNIATRRSPTVEFRYFNGSLNEKQSQANIKVAVGIINVSEKARFRDTDDENYKKREK